MIAAARALPAVLGAAAVALLAVPATADLVQLKDGRIIDGVKMRKEGEKILLLYENGTVPVALDRVEDYVIEGVEPFEPKTEKEKAKRAEGLVPFRGKWVKVAVRQKQLAKEQAARKQAIEEHKKHEAWANRYRFKTKNFEFESTLNPDINEHFSELMETYFKEFSKFWKTKVPKDWGRLRVCFYHDIEYFQRTGGVGPGTLAYYRWVAPRELNFFHDRKDPQNTLAYMIHEANHYLTDLMDEWFQYPHWVNEGMAEYYGSAVYDPVKKKMAVGAVQYYRLVEIRSDIDAGERWTVEKLVNDESRAYPHYSWGWSFVHFLMENKKYAKKFQKFFSDLARARDVERVPIPGADRFRRVTGKECARVFKKRMGVKNFDKLQAEWYAHIDSLDYNTVRGLETAGVRAFQEGRWRFRAPRLLEGAIEKGSTRPKAHIYYAMSLQLKQKSDEALQVLVDACGMDPLEPDFWAYRGYQLMQMNRKEEGRKFMDLAREMNPGEDYLDLEVMIKLAEVASKK